MNLHDEVKVFQRLSIEYRADPNEKTMRKIKQLVNENSERIARDFKLTLDTKESKFRKGRGIPMMGLSMGQYLQKGSNFKPRDMTCLNVNSKKSISGVNILLDYSGSMWFDEDRDTVDGIQRIYCQNFFALCLGVYVQRLSRGTMKILYTSIGNYPITLLDTDNMQTADWDSFLLEDECYVRYRPELRKPIVLQGTDDRYFDTIYPKPSFDRSYAEFKKHSYKNFITVVVTDGGMNRLGESRGDRSVFMKKLITTVASENRLMFWQFFGLQDVWGEETIALVKENQVPHSIVDTAEEYNICFSYVSHCINEIVAQRM